MTTMKSKEQIIIDELKEFATNPHPFLPRLTPYQKGFSDGLDYCKSYLLETISNFEQIYDNCF